MSLTEIYIGRSKYSINCQEDEVAKVQEIAAKLNKKVNELSLKIRDADEKTILMFCLMNSESELELLKNSNNLDIPLERMDFKKDKSNVTQAIQESEEGFIRNIENITLKIENLANKIKEH